MKIEVPRIDGRTRRGYRDHPIIDSETGRRVGTLSGRNGRARFDAETHEHTWIPSWRISLFGKYSRQFDSWHECVANAKAIEDVVNNVVAVPEPIIQDWKVA